MQDAQCENGLPDKKDLVAKTGKMQRVHRRQNKSKCKSKKSTKNCKKSLKNMPINDILIALDDCFLAGNAMERFWRGAANARRLSVK